MITNRKRTLFKDKTVKSCKIINHYSKNNHKFTFNSAIYRLNNVKMNATNATLVLPKSQIIIAPFIKSNFKLRSNCICNAFKTFSQLGKLVSVSLPNAYTTIRYPSGVKLGNGVMHLVIFTEFKNSKTLRPCAKELARWVSTSIFTRISWRA